MDNKEQSPSEQPQAAEAAEEKRRIIDRIWDYILTVGWLAQMDPTYPHTEFHPFEPTVPAPEPPWNPEPMKGPLAG